MLTKEQKKKIIEDLTDKMKRQKVLVFTNFSGLKTGEARDLRKQLKGVDSDYKVAKKTLIKLALEKTKKAVDVSQFESSLALIFGYDDPITPAKIISKFSREHKNLKILGGFFEDKFLSVEDVETLASIPSREELLARLVYDLSMPIRGFINVLGGNLRNFINLLKQIRDTNTRMTRE